MLDTFGSGEIFEQFRYVKKCFLFVYICEKKKKTSQYKGVYLHAQNGKWCTRLKLKGQPPKYGGSFYDELDAAKSVNYLCEAMDIPLQNPGISGIPTQRYQVI